MGRRLSRAEEAGHVPAGKTLASLREDQPKLSSRGSSSVLRPGLTGNLSVERSAGNLHATFVRGTEGLVPPPTS